MEEYSEDVNSMLMNKSLCMGIQFNTFDSETKDYEISIRYPSDLLSGGDQLIFSLGHYDTGSYRKWVSNGFIDVMKASA